MSKVRLTGSTSGYTEIQASAVAGDNTLSLPTVPNGTLVALDSNGRLGLGTSSPGAALHVNRAGDGTYASNIGETLSKAGCIINPESTGSSVQLNIAKTTGGDGIIYQPTNSTATTAYNNIFNPFGGNVGIGTTVPGSFDAEANQLVIGNGAGDQGLTIYTGDAVGSYGSIFFADGTSGGATKKGQIRYEQNNEVMSFWTNEAERCRIDLNGRLLVGTSSASTSTRAVFQGNSFSAGQPSIVYFQRDSNSTGLTAGAGITYLLFADNASGIYGQISCEVDGTAGSSDYPGRLSFSTTADGASSPTERMRLESDGYKRFHSAESGVIIGSASAAGTSVGLITGVHSQAGIVTGGTTSFTVTTNGDVKNTNSSYGQLTSDERFKQDIVDAPSQWDDIKAVRLTKYRWKSDPTGDLLLGPIAQELQAVSPGLVDKRIATAEDVPASGGLVAEGDEVLGFKASILYMKAVGALQEAMERIETLEAANTDLAARITALEAN